jgi:hypothetical protein
MGLDKNIILKSILMSAGMGTVHKLNCVMIGSSGEVLWCNVKFWVL